MHYLHLASFPSVYSLLAATLLPAGGGWGGGIVVFAEFLVTYFGIGLIVCYIVFNCCHGRLTISVVQCWLQLSYFFIFVCHHQISG